MKKTIKVYEVLSRWSDGTTGIRARFRKRKSAEIYIQEISSDLHPKFISETYYYKNSSSMKPVLYDLAISEIRMREYYKDKK